MGGNQLDAYDPATGQQLWYLPGIVGGRTITGPALGPELVYVTEGQKGELLAVKLGGKGELAPRSIAWRYDSNTPTRAARCSGQFAVHRQRSGHCHVF